MRSGRTWKWSWHDSAAELPVDRSLCCFDPGSFGTASTRFGGYAVTWAAKLSQEVRLTLDKLATAQSTANSVEIESVEPRTLARSEKLHGWLALGPCIADLFGAALAASSRRCDSIRAIHEDMKNFLW
eukprot:Skav223827  [mRNA]  locus=scaffold3121:94660:99434:- [translate_table: standard]